jgi:hypothetical protein
MWVEGAGFGLGVRLLRGQAPRTGRGSRAGKAGVRPPRLLLRFAVKTSGRHADRQARYCCQGCPDRQADQDEDKHRLLRGIWWISAADTNGIITKIHFGHNVSSVLRYLRGGQPKSNIRRGIIRHLSSSLPRVM